MSRWRHVEIAALIVSLLTTPTVRAQACPPVANPPSADDIARVRARVQAEPTSALAWDDLGELLVRACSLDEAARAFARARALGLQANENHVTAAHGYFAARDVARARILYEHVVAYPTHAGGPPFQVGVNFSSILISAGSVADVPRILAWTLRGNVDDQRAYRAVTAFLQQNESHVAVIFDRATELQAGNEHAIGATVLVGLAQVFRERWDDAAGEFSSALRLLADYPNRTGVAWVYLARSLFAKGALREAETAARVALRRDAGLSDGLFWLGRIYLAMQRPREAAEAFRAALAAEPGHPEAGEWLRRATVGR
jgi:tetratricopeptide (TPR) repeat protein